MRVLLLTPQLPYPPHQGTTLRNFNIIARLARHHEIHLLSLVTPEDDPANAHPLQRLCQRIYTAPQPIRPKWQRLFTTLTSPLPDMAHRLRSPAFQGILEQVLSSCDWDVIEFEGIEMIPYLGMVLEHVSRASRPPLLVFDDHNAEYMLQKRVFEMDIRLPQRWPGALYSLIQWQKLQRYEAWACRQVDVVAAVSEKDAEALQRIAPGLEAYVVPNGVDVAWYANYASSAAAVPPQSLVFTGKMDFRPNVDAVLWLARQVLPVVQEAIPDACFYIVGQRPHPRLDALKGRPGIVITGHVPDQRPYIGDADVYVIPLRSGGGTRLKVLEAMAMRRPIVSTTMGCDGFPVTDGREVMLADDPALFAEYVVELLRNPSRRDTLGQAGFQFASTHYDWANIVPRLEAAYEIGRRGGSGAQAIE